MPVRRSSTLAANPRGPAPTESRRAEELDRVIPVIEAITAISDIAISVDTSKPAVMQAAVACRRSDDQRCLRATTTRGGRSPAKLDAAVCLMHMQGEPGTMQDKPSYKAIPGDILEFLSDRVFACRSAGIGADRIVVDPGFGFGKTHEHNIELLARLRDFRELGMPLLVGLSRKRTLGDLTGKTADDRVSSGIAAAVLAVTRGANIVRTHDVAETVDALKITQAVMQAGQK